MYDSSPTQTIDRSVMDRSPMTLSAGSVTARSKFEEGGLGWCDSGFFSKVPLPQIESSIRLFTWLRPICASADRVEGDEP